MQETILFLSEGSLHVWQDDELIRHKSVVYEIYKQRVKEIKQKNDWKTSGTGAKFMGQGLAFDFEPDLSSQKPHINGISLCADGRVAYSLNLEKTGGIYLKDLRNPDEKEFTVAVDTTISFHELDVNEEDNIIVSVAENHFERHLALLHVNDSDYKLLTEGDSFDSNPKWSEKNRDTVYYDSCGIAYDDNGNFLAYGPKSIYRLDTKNKDLDEVLAEDRFDFYSPCEDQHGNLFYIKRPYKGNRPDPPSLTDFLTAPFKILGAIGGWLNFFTMRYSGQSLKTSGKNPALSPKKTPEEIFIDGNLLKAEKNLKQSIRMGEKNPGYVPSNWELIMRTPSGEEKILKKGVLSYCVIPGGKVLYSNGQYVVALEDGNREKIIAKVHLATKLAK